MDILAAHDKFAERSDRSIYPVGCKLAGMDYWPSIMTALASLSGMLDDCHNDADLDEAVQHTLTLLHAEILAESAVTDEAARVFKAVLDWVEEYERQEERRQQAEGNLRFVWYGPFQVTLN